MSESAFQDLIPGNSCFGCGPGNQNGLRIKSYWDSEDVSICRFHPQPHQNAGPPEYLNGGIIATLVDCHSICTAIADAYRREGRQIGVGPPIWYVTGSLSISYQRPIGIAGPVALRARVAEVGEKKTVLKCVVSSDGTVCAEAEVVAVRVSSDWRASAPG